MYMGELVGYQASVRQVSGYEQADRRSSGRKSEGNRECRRESGVESRVDKRRVRNRDYKQEAISTRGKQDLGQQVGSNPDFGLRTEGGRESRHQAHCFCCTAEDRRREDILTF